MADHIDPTVANPVSSAPKEADLPSTALGAVGLGSGYNDDGGKFTR